MTDAEDDRTLMDDERTMDKLKERQEMPEERTGPGDFYEVVSNFGTWYVSGATAARIGQALERRLRPRYVKFVDMAGSRAWVRTDRIESITESTALQRDQDRAFHYLKRKENRAARKWDDDID